MSGQKSVAIAVTSYHGPFYEDGAKTGAFYVEVYHPWKVFHDAGYHVDIVSETGTFGWDDHSLGSDFVSADEKAASKDGPFAQAISSVKKASDVNAAKYSIINIAGGHGTVFDFPEKAPDLANLASQIWNNDGIVVAVCHGPCIIKHIHDKGTSKSIASGRRATGFPDEGETILKLDDLLKSKGYVYTADIVKEAGAKYEVADPPFDAKVVVDGRLVTGANPASATPAAQAALKLVS